MSISITLGNGNEFGIDDDNDMFVGRVSETGSRIYLGKATFRNFQQLIGHMERLQIHLIMEPKKETHDEQSASLSGTKRP